MVRNYVVVQSAQAGPDGDMFHYVNAYQGDRSSGHLPNRPISVTGYIQTAAGCFPASNAAVKQVFGPNGQLQVKYSSCHAGTPEDFTRGVEDAAKRTHSNKEILQQSRGSLGLKVLGGAVGVAVVSGAMIMQGMQNFHMAEALSADGVWTQEEVIHYVYENVTFGLNPVGESVGDVGKDLLDQNATNVISDPTASLDDPGLVEEGIRFMYKGVKEGFKAIFGL